MFDNCRTTTDQGNIGEAAAILYFTKLGGIVCKPLFINTDYDFVVDMNGVLNRVQCKTSQQRNVVDTHYVVNLKNSGVNARKHTYSPLSPKKVDIVFVLAEDGTCWSIPTTELTAFSAMCLNERFDEFKV
jgi:hypothetical protein